MVPGAIGSLCRLGAEVGPTVWPARGLGIEMGPAVGSACGLGVEIMVQLIGAPAVGPGGTPRRLSLIHGALAVVRGGTP